MSRRRCMSERRPVIQAPLTDNTLSIMRDAAVHNNARPEILQPELRCTGELLFMHVLLSSNNTLLS